MLMASCAFIPSTFFHFSLTFIKQAKQHRKKIPILYALSTIYCLLSFTPLLVQDVKPRLFFPFWPSPGPFFLSLILMFIGVILLTLILLYKRYKNLKNSTRRNQLKYLIIATTIGYGGGLTNFPLWYDIPLPPYGNILVSLFGSIIAYAIVKHQLMDIRIVINRGIVYSVLIAAMTIIYLLIVFVLEKFTQTLFGYHSITISIGAAFALGLAFIPLRHRVQYFMDRTFFKGSADEIARQNEQLRREITQSEKYKTLSTLATGIAHEIKNPLTAIKTFSEYLPRKMDDKEFLNKFAILVGREVDRIDSMVHQLLDYGKPAPISLRQTNVCALIQETLDILNSRLITQNITLIRQPPTTPCHALVDPNQIKQALLNIFLNAIDAMEGSGTLTVETRIKGAEDQRVKGLKG